MVLRNERRTKDWVDRRNECMLGCFGRRNECRTKGWVDRRNVSRIKDLVFNEVQNNMLLL